MQRLFCSPRHWKGKRQQYKFVLFAQWLFFDVVWVIKCAKVGMCVLCVCVYACVDVGAHVDMCVCLYLHAMIIFLGVWSK